MLEKISAYMYVHKKHRGLVPRFTGVLKAMAEENLFERYRAIAFEE